MLLQVDSQNKHAHSAFHYIKYGFTIYPIAETLTYLSKLEYQVKIHLIKHVYSFFPLE